MNEVIVGVGKIDGKGVYAAKDFKKGEVVTKWNLKAISHSEFDDLPASEHKFVHSFWNVMYLFPSPSRYTNHSRNPNTISDFKKHLDYAIRDIKKGEMITTDARVELITELRTFVESIFKFKITDFRLLKGGYRNATICYKTKSSAEIVTSLRRVAGNWRIIDNDS